jgi:predicted RNase H-like nuclease (RuvC/YqgF family)
VGTGYRGELVALRARKEALEAELEEERAQSDQLEAELEEARARPLLRRPDSLAHEFDDHVDALVARPDRTPLSKGQILVVIGWLALAALVTLGLLAALT